ncbi:hypothetical protein EUGRSUZ_I00781 [Eucalyptus grandis]|uniref:Uncharacterized protein n=2 Tax=Eucalyptus grandis TaxID=71139 RepID=A0ACC3JD93_EUCGR|nr:hypothetical protein EUGRSUZ_I00781 [Eucalyptus grandis]
MADFGQNGDLCLELGEALSRPQLAPFHGNFSAIPESSSVNIAKSTLADQKFGIEVVGSKMDFGEGYFQSQVKIRDDGAMGTLLGQFTVRIASSECRQW